MHAASIDPARLLRMFDDPLLRRPDESDSSATTMDSGLDESEDGALDAPLIPVNRQPDVRHAASRDVDFTLNRYGRWKYIGMAAQIAAGDTERPVLAIICKVMFIIVSLLISILLVPLIAVDCLSYINFEARTLASSYNHFVRQTYTKGPIFVKQVEANHIDGRGRWASKLYVGSNAFTHGVFVAYSLILIALFGLAGIQKRNMKNGGIWNHFKEFQRHLTDHPPDFPISCNDQVFGYDQLNQRFQLSMLFIMEKITYEEVAETFRQRWILWEPKTRAVTSWKWGRPCFKVLHNDEFRLENHIKRKQFDLSTTSLAQTVSEIASTEIPPEQPQWQVWVIEAVNHPAQLDGEPATVGLSYLFGKWNHVYADGSGMMTSVVTRLADIDVSTADLPEQYRRAVPPPYQVLMYYVWHVLRTACLGLQFWCLSAFGTPPAAALMQARDDLLIAAPPATGRKYYSAPGVFNMEEISNLRNAIAQHCGKKPTVNDIFSYLITNACAQLGDSKQLDCIVRQRLDIPTKPGVRQMAESARKKHSQSISYIQTIIPMMCRTSMPTRMDNFTSLVPTRLPVPDSSNWELNLDANKRVASAVASIQRIKAVMDDIKQRQLRQISFILTCVTCKALPNVVAKKIHVSMHKSMQLCSTNVAAPPIESQFFGKHIHGLFFWPAVPGMLTMGTAVVSLGARFQLLTFMDECELMPAAAIAQKWYSDNGFKFGTQERTQVLEKMSDVIVDLVVQEFARLLSMFHPIPESTNPRWTIRPESTISTT